TSTTTSGRSWSYGLKEFPLVWPAKPEIRRRHSDEGATAFVMNPKRRATLRPEPIYETKDGTNGATSEEKITETGSQRAKLKPREPANSDAGEEASENQRGESARARLRSSPLSEKTPGSEKPAGAARETSFLTTQHLSALDLFKRIDSEEDAE